MLQSAVLRKTKKGAEEVETRQHRLPGRLRNVLIMIDGERDLASYLEQAGELAPQIEQYLQDLLTTGFIEIASGGADAVRAAPPSDGAAEVAATVATARATAALSIDEARERINNYLGETMGMRAVFLRGQLAAIDNVGALLDFIDATAQAYATTAGPQAAQQWREQARTILEGNDN
jgi:hypothetical protein